MKSIIFFLLLATVSSAQGSITWERADAIISTPISTIKQDTTFGLAVVIDTIREVIVIPIKGTEFFADLGYGRLETRHKLTTAVIPAYTITIYEPAAPRVVSIPRVISVAYFSFEDCTEIPFCKLIAFKH